MQQRHTVPLLQPLVVACYLLAASLCVIEATGDECWTSGELEECTIQATLYQTTSIAVSNGMTMNIDCLGNGDNANATEEESNNAALEAYKLRRFERVQNVTLDGCRTSFRGSTYGLEFLPNCERFVQIVVERFHADVLQRFNCSQALQTEIVRFEHNEIGFVGEESLLGLSQLQEIYFLGNSLRHIDRSAFEKLPVVELLHIEKETLLALKEDPDFLERSSVADLHLIFLKELTPALFQRLPDTMRQLLVAQTPIADGASIEVLNPQLLRNISIISCALRSFTLIDSHSTVLYLNLSGNAIVNFHIKVTDERNAHECAVETLDLSDNKLVQMPEKWLSAMGKLRHIVLRGNRLKTFSLPLLLAAAPNALLIDLRANELEAMLDTSAYIDSDRTRIQIDDNPWNCQFLLYVAHTYPQNFRIFQYAKYISKINVNGLECQPAELPETSTTTVRSAGKQLADAETLELLKNVSTYTLVYGNPGRDMKHSQRTEALILVFILPIGIAVLFLLLYLWIYCQKLFHMSYYRSIHCCCQRATGVRSRSAERFDVVRHIPPQTLIANNNEDYEMPLNGTICNCANAHEKCRKTHHITYEELPAEHPYKIYEEIIEGCELNDVEAGAHVAQSFYDHLHFEPAPKSQ